MAKEIKSEGMNGSAAANSAYIEQILERKMDNEDVKKALENKANKK